MASDLRVSWNRLPGPVVLVDHAASIFRLRTDAPGGIMTRPGVLPDRITIYRPAICAICRTGQEVDAQVRRTVIHEIARHFRH